MSPEAVKSQISELDAVRRQTRMVRWGTTLVALAFTVVCVLIMKNSVTSLFVEGPTQEAFTSKVQTNLETQVLPGLKSLAMQTATDSRPIVEKELAKLDSKVPSIAEATMTEFGKLQEELPPACEKVLDTHFTATFKKREDKLRKMFPEMSDEKIQTFMTNMTDEGVTQLTNINTELFTPHMQTMQNIAADMQKIEVVEAPNLKSGDVPTMQMGLLLFDIARADMKGFELPIKGGKAVTPTSGAAKPAADAKPMTTKPAAKPAAAATPKGY